LLKPLVALALALAFAAPASAASRRIAILDLVTEGLAPDVRAQFETTIEEELRKAGYLVVAHATVADVVAKKEDLVEGCTFGRCVAGIARALEADQLLDVRISADGASYAYVLSVVEPRYGTPIAQELSSCPVCTVAEALGKTAHAVAALDAQLRASPLRDTGVEAPRAKKSKLAPVLLMAGGLALAGGGTAIVAGTEQKEVGWVTIGSGGTVFLTGLILLLAGD
jgi:hypothetical protein